MVNKTEKWQERSFPFWRKFEELCHEYRITIKDNKLVDLGHKHRENPAWYIFLEELDDSVMNPYHSFE